MIITIICPNLRCRNLLQVPDSVRGKKVRCGSCGNNFLVPEAPQKRMSVPNPDDEKAVTEENVK